MAQVAGGYLDELHRQDPAVPDAATANAGGDVIVTTFSRSAMVAAVRAVRAGLLSRLDPSRRAVDRGVQVGLATVATRTGELLAFYPGDSDYNTATQAQIEPGSQLQVFADAVKLPDPVKLLDPASVKAAPPSLWTLLGRVGLTQNLVADPAELPEPLSKLEQDPDLALGIAPESPARMAAAFAVFGDSGTYHDLAMALSVTVNGRRVWTFRPHGTPALGPLALRVLSTTDLNLGVPVIASAPSQAAPRFGGVPGTIGGDHSAWYTGLAGGTVTSVALWDTQPGPHGVATQHSLAGLGGVPASGTVSWPIGIWSYYVKVAAEPQSQPRPTSAAQP
jgi:penicillin-binding protein 1A